MSESGGHIVLMRLTALCAGVCSISAVGAGGIDLGFRITVSERFSCYLGVLISAGAGVHLKTDLRAGRLELF